MHLYYLTKKESKERRKGGGRGSLIERVWRFGTTPVSKTCIKLTILQQVVHSLTIGRIN